MALNKNFPDFSAVCLSYIALFLFICMGAATESEAAEWFFDTGSVADIMGFDDAGNIHLLFADNTEYYEPGGVHHTSGNIFNQIAASAGLGSHIDNFDGVVAGNGDHYILMRTTPDHTFLNGSFSVVGTDINGFLRSNSSGNAWVIPQSSLGIDLGIIGDYLASDSAGNLYVTGYPINDSTGTRPYTTIPLRKYSSQGNLLWSKNISAAAALGSGFFVSPSGDPPPKIIYRNGFIYLAVNGATIQSKTETTTISSLNVFIYKIDVDSGDLMWGVKFGPAPSDNSKMPRHISLETTHWSFEPDGSLILLARDYRDTVDGYKTGMLWGKVDDAGTVVWQRLMGASFPASVSLPGLSDPDDLGTYSAFTIASNGHWFLGTSSHDPNNFNFHASLMEFDPAKGTLEWSLASTGNFASQRSSIFADLVADNNSNIYGTGYSLIDYTGPRFLLKNPQIESALKVSVNPTLSPVTLETGPGINPTSLKNIKVISLNMQALKADYTVDALTIYSRGAGSEQHDIETVRLLADNSVIATLPGSNFHTGSTAANGATITFHDLNRIISKDSTEVWEVEYDFSENACAASDGYSYNDGSRRGTFYVAQLDARNNQTPVLMKPLDAPVVINSAEGPIIKIDPGHLVQDAATNNQTAEKLEKLPLSLKVTVVKQSTDTVCGSLLWFNVVSKPDSSAGELLQTKGPIIPDKISGSVDDWFKLGDKSGLYEVEAILTTPLRPAVHGTAIAGGGNGGSHTVTDRPTPLPRFGSHAKQIQVARQSFTATASGIDIISATHNGHANAPETFGTFIQNIKAENNFSATAEPKTAINKVTFAIGKTESAGVGGNGSYTSGLFDMASLTPGVNEMKVTAVSGAKSFIDTANIEVIAFPSWLTTLPSIAPSMVLEFQGDKDRYHAGFSWPVDFAWSKAVDSVVLLLGGEQNEANLQFSANAFYQLDKASSFNAAGGYTATVLGRSISLDAELSGSFNSLFRFQGGHGKFHALMPFTFPDKGASKTIFVYGVPITMAVEIGGGGNVNLTGSALVGSNIEFKKIIVIPGIDVTLSATASIEAVFGLAKLGANASPLTELQLRLLYISAGGLDTTFGGRITVPLSVFGSIFWGVGSGTLASTTLGPYTFGSMLSTSSYRTPLSMPSSLASPELIVSGAMAADSTGHRMLIYTKDTDAGAAVNPDLYFRLFDGTAWQTPAVLASEPLLWEMDPALTFLSNGQALALWTANDGNATLSDINQIFAHQDIRYALWNGSSWSTPLYLVDDDEADGVADITFDSVNNKAIAVWLHDSNSDDNITTRDEWNIQAAEYNTSSAQWSLPSIISGGADGFADYMPALASASGTTMAVWATDEDGEFFTTLSAISNGSNVSYDNSDGYIRYAIFNGSSWSAPAMIPGSKTGFVSFPAAAWSPDASRGLVVWVGKENGLHPGSVMTKLYYASYSSANSIWSTPKVLAAAGEWSKEDLQVFLDANDQAEIIWQGRTPDGLQQDMFSVSLDLKTDTAGTLRQLTDNPEVEMGLSAVKDGSGKIFASWIPHGGSQVGTDNGSGIAAGQLSLNSATITSVADDMGVDINGDGFFDVLRISVAVDAVQPGDYRIALELNDANDGLISRGTGRATLQTAANHTIIVDIPAPVIADHGVDGPFIIKTIRLFDDTNSGLIVHEYGQSVTTKSYDITDFGQGVIAFDQEIYDGFYSKKAVITVRDPDANRDDSKIDVVQVELDSMPSVTGGIRVSLQETGGATGVFQVAMPFSKQPVASPGLQVADGTSITVSYSDESGSIWRDTAVWQETEILKGDVDNSGVITISDAIIAIRSLVQDKADSAAIDRRADINGDKRISNIEVVYILHYLAGHGAM